MTGCRWFAVSEFRMPGALALRYLKKVVAFEGPADIKSCLRPGVGNGYSEILFMVMQYMGKGDIRTRRGKIYRGSFGKTRPRKKKKARSGRRS